MPGGQTIRPGTTTGSFPLTMGGEEFGFQYSPYVYYNEHCIVFNRTACAHEDRQELLCEAV